MIAVWGFAPAITEPGVLASLIRNSKPIDQYIAELKAQYPFAFARTNRSDVPNPNVSWFANHDQGPTVPGTPATPQPHDPTEGGSVGPEIPDVPLGAPQINPDPGIEQHPHKAIPLPPMEPPTDDAT